MVTEIKNERVRAKIGTVSLEVDDLIEILEKRNFKSVQARNKNYRFESLDDIKANRSLLAGKPDVDMDRIYIRFSKNGTYIDSLSTNEEIRMLIHSLAAEIVARKTVFDFFLHYCFRVIVLVGLISYIFAYLEWSPEKYSHILSSAYYPYIKGFSAIVAMIALPLLIYNSFRDPIIVRKKEGFGKYTREILMVAITAVVSVVITSLVSRYF